MKLNIKAVALAFGLTWGFSVFFLTWWLIFFDGPTGETLLLGRLYRGYTVSPAGSLIGLIWGFLDAGIGALILAWLYNFFAGKFAKA